MIRVFVLLAALVLTCPAVASAQGFQVAGQTSLWRASKVIGVPVFNGQNEKIGEISDLILDEAGVIQEVIISVAGLPGAGHQVGVKLNVLRFPHKIEPGTAPTDAVNDRWFPDQAILPTSKEALLALPAFK